MCCATARVVGKELFADFKRFAGQSGSSGTFGSQLQCGGVGGVFAECSAGFAERGIGISGGAFQQGQLQPQSQGGWKRMGIGRGVTGKLLVNFQPRLIDQSQQLQCGGALFGSLSPFNRRFCGCSGTVEDAEGIFGEWSSRSFAVFKHGIGEPQQVRDVGKNIAGLLQSSDGGSMFTVRLQYGSQFAARFGTAAFTRGQFPPHGQRFIAATEAVQAGAESLAGECVSGSQFKGLLIERYGFAGEPCSAKKIGDTTEFGW